MSSEPITIASMLLKSCAIPPVNAPSDSIFWTWRSWASTVSRAAISAWAAASARSASASAWPTAAIRRRASVTIM